MEATRSLQARLRLHTFFLASGDLGFRVKVLELSAIRAAVR